MTEYRLQSSNYTISKFGLTTIVIEKGDDDLRVIFNNPIRLFQETMVRRFAETYEQILCRFSAIEPDDALRLTNLRPSDWPFSLQSLKCASECNDDDDGWETLRDLFRGVARLSCQDDIAVICGTTRLSYADLDERSGRLAAHLRATVDLQSDNIIALVLDPSELLVISIVAIWRVASDRRLRHSRISQRVRRDATELPPQSHDNWIAWASNTL